MIWSGNQEPVNRRPKDKETQSKESTAMRRGNLAGVLGGFHRHVEELLLRHAALRSLAPADFDSTPTASSNSGRSLQLLGYNTGKQACMYYKRNGYGALVGLEPVP